jgi:Leucine-rich repeat (LRR) protein
MTSVLGLVQTSLPRNAFHALRHLSTLDVSNNTIVEVGNAFTDMPDLKYLDLSYNHLPIVKKGSFRNLPSLVGLRLDFNSIIDLEEDSFTDLQSLETLILTKNGISVVRRGTFRNLPSLEKLRLDDNLVERLDDRSFTDLYSLKELHLDHNLLEEVSERAFDRVPSIR